MDLTKYNVHDQVIRIINTSYQQSVIIHIFLMAIQNQRPLVETSNFIDGFFFFYSKYGLLGKMNWNVQNNLSVPSKLIITVFHSVTIYHSIHSEIGSSPPGEMH